MFDIIVRLMDLALAAFLSRQTDTEDNNYKELYLMYLAMNDVIAKSVTANEHYLPVSWNSPFLVTTLRHLIDANGCLLSRVESDSEARAIHLLVRSHSGAVEKPTMRYPD